MGRDLKAVPEISDGWYLWAAVVWQGSKAQGVQPVSQETSKAPSVDRGDTEGHLTGHLTGKRDPATASQ